jgi:Flp pilus assembly secretin CpaC
MTHVLRRLLARAGAVAAAAFGVFIAGVAQSADTITVVLDQATITRLPDRVATLVIGNPLVADASIQPGGMMILTGKGYGTTNLVALDRDGAILMNRSILVTSPQDHVVVVYRGVTRESYSCAPNCERRITLGDTPEYFEATLNQAGNRSTRAGGGGGGQAAPR